MTTQEFSNEFDVLYNNIMSNQAPGLNEYEKSVFLTKAQDEIIKSHFNAKSNPIQEGFDDSAKRQIDFSSILFTKKLNPVTMDEYPKLHPGSSIFRIDANILMIINESIKLSDGTLISVIPATYTDITNLLLKPYKYPPKNQAWRYLNNLDKEVNTSTSGFENWIVSNALVAEVVTAYNTANCDYVIRYVKRPNPIILVDLDDNYGGLSISGYSKVSECELDKSLHIEILQRAVELAKVAYAGDVNSIVELGKRSE